MKRKHRAIKPYLELTTASLLAQKREWVPTRSTLPRRTLLLVVPRENRRMRSRLLRIAQSFRERGGEAVVRYVSETIDTA